jgi:hypothetical protein
MSLNIDNDNCEYGQFVVIHPDMYDYKREIDSHLVVRQKIGQELIDEMGEVVCLQPTHHHVIYPSKDRGYDSLTYSNTGSYFTLCAIRIIVYVYNKFIA